MELITAVLLMLTEQSMVASAVEQKVESITPDAVLLRNGISLPGCPPRPSERYGAWYKLSELNSYEVEELALEAGWRFTFIAPRLQVTALGLTRQAAISRAAVKATHEVTSWGFAAFEVGNIDVQDLVGIYRANLLVHVRQPRPSPLPPRFGNLLLSTPVPGFRRDLLESVKCATTTQGIVGRASHGSRQTER